MLASENKVEFNGMVNVQLPIATWFDNAKRVQPNIAQQTKMYFLIQSEKCFLKLKIAGIAINRIQIIPSPK